MLIRAGDYRDALEDVTATDTVITDPPFSARTHAGARTTKGLERGDASTESPGITYAPWTPFDAADLIDFWAPRIRLWIFVMTDHVLWPFFEERARKHDLHTFAPVSIVIPGMTVRQLGDGPASWTIWGMAARRKGFLDPANPTTIWRALPGSYVVPRQHADRAIGDGRGKPLWLLHALVRDYSNPGHTICDPCAGYGSTLRAALELRRHAVGAELDAGVAKEASDELATGHLQPALLV